MSVATMGPLQALLLRPAPSGVAHADAPISSCLDAYLPIYSFSASDSAAIAPTKLRRVDSMPVVPDMDAYSCDSPSSDFTHFTGSSGNSFNNLPFEMAFKPAAAYGYAPDFAAAAPRHGSRGAATDAYDNAAVVPDTGGRSLPRRHASDVFLCRHDTPDGGSEDEGAAVPEAPEQSLLEAALTTLWDDRADRGLFRYDVSACPTRVVPGAWGFLAQLNEGRATKKRATEFTMDRVVQPFDASKFNFRKAAISEALVAFQPAAGGAPPRLLPPAAPLAAAAAAADAEGAVQAGGGGPNLVLINVSPIDYGHVLLVPRVLAGLPQALDAGCVLLALQFARELGGPAFRVGYNSLGAFATINHLHFQSYYMPLTMPVERAATALLPGALGRPAAAPPPGGKGAAAAALGKRRRDDDDYADEQTAANGNAVRVSRLLDYPVNAFVVELEAAAAAAAAPGGAAAALAAPGGLEAVAAVVGGAAQRMQAANQPFNLLISEGGARVFVIPQRYAERQAAGLVAAELLDTGVNPAAFEIAGHILLKRPEDYEAASEGWAARLLAEVSLEEGRFQEVAQLCFGGGAGC